MILFINKYFLYLLTEQTKALRVLHKLIVPKESFTAIDCKFEQVYMNKLVRQLWEFTIYKLKYLNFLVSKAIK